MPITHSAEKRMRSDQKKRLANQAALSELRTLNKRVLAALAESPIQPEKAKSEARLLIKRLDKAASRGIIPKQRADRKKSRIGKWLTKAKIGL